MITPYSRRVPARSSVPAVSGGAVAGDVVSTAKVGSLRGIVADDVVEALIPVEDTVDAALSLPRS
jgi:hypothetical protein